MPRWTIPAKVSTTIAPPPAEVHLLAQDVQRVFGRSRTAVWPLGRDRVEDVDDADDLGESGISSPRSPSG